MARPRKNDPTTQKIQRDILRVRKLKQAAARAATAKDAVRDSLELARIADAGKSFKRRDKDTPLTLEQIARLDGIAKINAMRKFLGGKQSAEGIRWAREIREERRAKGDGICGKLILRPGETEPHPCRAFKVKGADRCREHIRGAQKDALLLRQVRLGRAPLIRPNQTLTATVWGLRRALAGADFPRDLLDQPVFVALCTEVFRLTDLGDRAYADHIRTLTILALEMIACWTGDATTEAAVTARAHRWAALAALAAQHGF